MQRIISSLVTLFPQRYKEAVFGTPSSPSWAASVVHRLLDALPGERFPVLPCRGVLEGFRMKIDWRKHRSYIYGTWEPGVVERISRAVSKGSVALDIGSHIGFYAFVLAKLVGQDGLVLAFEPLPENFKILEENVRLNPTAKIRAVNKAVADRSCKEMKLVVPDDASSTTSPHGSFFIDRGKTLLVESVSIDDLAGELKLPVNFIKMDAEGAEGLILEGALKTIERHRPSMLIELHHPQGYSENNRVIELLSELNYEIEWLDRYPLTSHIMAKPGKTR